MATLTELAIKYSSEKYWNHSYIDSGFYEELFSGITVRRLLELGVGYQSLMVPFLPANVPYVHGSSLYMWRAYFPEAEIYGCDIREDTLFQEDRIHTFPCDQTNVDDLHTLMVVIMMHSRGDTPDVIIDDGSHEPDSQILTAKTLLPYVADHGIYIVEDCREPEKVVAALGCGEIHRFHKRPDDVLIVIKK